jgi:hypothetical protein
MRQKSEPEKQPAEDAIRDIRRATKADSKGGWLTIQIMGEEFERLDFAIRRTRCMASDLDAAYLKAFAEART